jgi:hypothetical protein
MHALRAIALTCAFVAVQRADAQDLRTPVRVRVDQHAIAEKLLSGSDREKSVAVAMARDLPADAVTPQLRMALIEALTQENVRHRAHSDRMYSGQPSTLPYPEFRMDVAEILIPFKLTAAIPALAGALGMGPIISNALADFGNQAVAPVLSVLASARSGGAIHDGLLTLRFLVEDRAQRPLTAASLAGIQREIEKRLTDQVRADGLGVTYLWYAIDVAAVMNEPGLRRHLEALAADVAASKGRGVSDPDLAMRTKQRAGDRLAGVPAQPRRSRR